MWGGGYADLDFGEGGGKTCVGDLICEVLNMTITIAFKETDNCA